jgi:aldehyde dehydrogenase (NAD+)
MKEVEAACLSAEKAFDSWKDVTPPARGRLLFDVGRLMSLPRARRLFIDALIKETGKTAEEAEGELRSAVDMAFFMAGEGRRMYGDTTHSELPSRWAMTKRYPIGVCGIIVPWNFPLSLMAWKVFPALLCGNAVVLKPSSKAKHVADLFMGILREAGIPLGVVNMVHGDGETGNAVVRNPKVRMVSFTGSTEVGKEIAGICAGRLVKCSLELGGKNAVIVMDDADLDLAVDAVVKGAFSFAGQRCSATSRVIVHYSVFNVFMDKLVKATKSYPVRRAIDRAHVDSINAFLKAAVEADKGHILCGGRVDYRSKGVEPTIITDVSITSHVATQEIFGPVLIAFYAKSLDDAITIHNSSPFGLSGSIFTKDINVALSAIDRMECGVVYCNASTFGAEVHMPFGGVKQSGNGSREVGTAALETFSELKTVYMDYSGALQNAQFQRR